MARIVPATVIINSTPQLDRYGKPVMGLVKPLKKADGHFIGSTPLLAQPLFNVPNPIGVVYDGAGGNYFTWGVLENAQGKTTEMFR